MDRRATLGAVVLWAIGAVAVSGPAAAQFWSLGAGASPGAVSADGSVVAGTNATQYFRWTRTGGLVTIGGAAPGVNAAGGQPGISADGRFVSGTVTNPVSGLFEAGRYDSTAGTWQPLGGIGGPSGSSTSSGWGISADGQSVVGLGWVTAGRAEAVQWRSSTNTMVSLGSTVSGRSSRANGVSADGNVVVGWQDGPTGFRQAAVWTNGVQQTLTGPGGELLGEAGRVSADGQWVVGIANSGTGNRTWRWSASTGTQFIPSIFNAAWGGGATGISSTGVVVGFHRPFGPALFGEGFIWTETMGMMNLTSWVQSQGVTLPAGVVLSLPLGISADGLTIVGQGRTASGAIGWVVTIPTPGTAAVLVLGGLAASRRRR